MQLAAALAGEDAGVLQPVRVEPVVGHAVDVDVVDPLAAALTVDSHVAERAGERVVDVVGLGRVGGARPASRSRSCRLPTRSRTV